MGVLGWPSVALQEVAGWTGCKRMTSRDPRSRLQDRWDYHLSDIGGKPCDSHRLPLMSGKRSATAPKNLAEDEDDFDAPPEPWEILATQDTSGKKPSTVSKALQRRHEGADAKHFSGSGSSSHGSRQLKAATGRPPVKTPSILKNPVKGFFHQSKLVPGAAGSKRSLVIAADEDDDDDSDDSDGSGDGEFDFSFGGAAKDNKNSKPTAKGGGGKSHADQKKPKPAKPADSKLKAATLDGWATKKTQSEREDGEDEVEGEDDEDEGCSNDVLKQLLSSKRQKEQVGRGCHPPVTAALLGSRVT